MNNTSSKINEDKTVLTSWMNSWVVPEKNTGQEVPIPAYLEEVYWWAYVRPYAIAFFDRPWIVNLILLGNMVKLRDKALDELGHVIPGRTLQIASVYGDFVPKLVQRLPDGGSLDVVDVVPAQLENLRKKLPENARVTLIQNDSTHLNLKDSSYDQVVMFFLLHEMPADVREKTLSEALRALKPGGKLVIVDYHKPISRNPLKYLFPLMFRLLEPFALDIWEHNIDEWLPTDFIPKIVTKETIFGGLYQKVIIHK